MNKINRGNAETVGQGLVFVGVVFIVLAAGAALVWPTLVADDTAVFDTAAGALTTLMGIALFFASRA